MTIIANYQFFRKKYLYSFYIIRQPSTVNICPMTKREKNNSEINEQNGNTIMLAVFVQKIRGQEFIF